MMAASARRGEIILKRGKCMQTKRLTKSVVSILCVVLLAVAVLMTAGCNGNHPTDSSAPSVAATVVGEGETVFDFTVTKPAGTIVAYEVHTDKTTVGAALTDCGLIAGEEGDYGLYVKTVAGVTLDYDTDKMYWAFYEDGAYAVAGVDKTDIAAGVKYSFRASK